MSHCRPEFPSIVRIGGLCTLNTGRELSNDGRRTPPKSADIRPVARESRDTFDGLFPTPVSEYGLER